MGVHTQKKKGGQLNAFGRADIIYLLQEGMRPSEIAKRAKKTSGKLGKVDSVRKTIRKFKRIKGKWDGERKLGSGPPCKLTEKEKAEIVKLVFAKRGKAVVTIRYVQQCMPALRRVGRWCISNALHEAGLAWLRRRNKRKLSLKHRQARRKFARWVLTQPSDMWRKVGTAVGHTLKVGASVGGLLQTIITCAHRCSTGAFKIQRRAFIASATLLHACVSLARRLFATRFSETLRVKADGAAYQLVHDTCIDVVASGCCAT